MDNSNRKKSYGFLSLLVFIVIGLSIFSIIKFIEYKQTENPTTSQGNKDGNSKPLSRSAKNSDVTIASDLDLSSFGVKYTITPKTNISGLVVTVSLLDSNKKVLTTIPKQLGNATEGVQISFSISLFDLGLSVAWNTKYESLTITGGTVSYFD